LGYGVLGSNKTCDIMICMQIVRLISRMDGRHDYCQEVVKREIQWGETIGVGSTA